MAQSLEGDFNPSVHFLGLIKKSIDDGLARKCSMAGGPQIFIAPLQMAYYSPASDIRELKTLCQAQPFDLQIEPLPNWNPDAGAEEIQAGRLRLRAKAQNPLAGLQARPLGELLWFAALTASNGHLLQGCRADDPLRLKQWPDFSVLPHQESHLMLAQYLFENTADLLTAAKDTGIPLGQVYDFHNACSSLGLIERGNVFEPEEYFAGIILKSRHDSLMRRCALPGLPPVFLSPVEQCYYTDADVSSLSQYYSASSGDLQVEVVDSLDFGMEEEEEEVIQVGRMMVRRKKESQAKKPPSAPLDALLWNSILQSSRGRLLAGAKADVPVRLKRWPDFSRLSHDKRFLPLAAFMGAHGADVPTVAKRTAAPLPLVVDFHNACSVLGYLEYLPKAQMQERQVSEQERVLYRNISKSLNGMRAKQNA